MTQCWRGGFGKTVWKINFLLDRSHGSGNLKLENRLFAFGRHLLVYESDDYLANFITCGIVIRRAWRTHAYYAKESEFKINVLFSVRFWKDYFGSSTLENFVTPRR